MRKREKPPTGMTGSWGAWGAPGKRRWVSVGSEHPLADGARGAAWPVRFLQPLRKGVGNTTKLLQLKMLLNIIINKKMLLKIIIKVFLDKTSTFLKQGSKQQLGFSIYVDSSF